MGALGYKQNLSLTLLIWCQSGSLSDKLFNMNKKKLINQCRLKLHIQNSALSAITQWLDLYFLREKSAMHVFLF